ncbi:indolethylamine N-methyltransferase-like [Ixodes scapularis]|uniref:indolethylamine N-methyltransferase-like n=1 Tax=Ixodes scapularis TaxID=6945 RepID=UPI001A9EAC2C|nr:indolethylamine N-methyltransferase-like [Ixodes scapularis]
MLGSVESQKLIAHFKKTFVGKSYAARKKGPGNIFHQEELHRIFQSDLAQGKTLLEVGVGPLVWYSFMSSNRFNDIVLSDLVEDNRKELEKWLNKCEDAIDWTYRAEQVAALEGYSDVKKGASEIMERTRSSIRKVVPCNVLEPGVLPEEHKETFDVVLSCNCLESATADHESFRSVVNNVGSLVKPGGLFLLGGMSSVKSFFPKNIGVNAEDLSEDLIKGAVTNAGFQLKVYRTKNIEIAGNPGAFSFILAAHPNNISDSVPSTEDMDTTQADLTPMVATAATPALPSKQPEITTINFIGPPSFKVYFKICKYKHSNPPLENDMTFTSIYNRTIVLQTYRKCAVRPDDGA